MTLNEYVDRQRASVPAKPSETFGQYVARLLDGYRVVKMRPITEGTAARGVFVDITEELT